MKTSLTALPCALLLLAGTAHAAQRTLSAAGAKLVIDSPCARTVAVQPDPSLSGHFELVASADHKQELDALNFDNGDAARLSGPDRCWGAEGLFGLANSRTLTLVIRVPAGTNLAIDESSPTTYTLGDIGGVLTLDLSAPVQLNAASATDVKADLSGPGEVKIGQVRGKLEADMSGPAHIIVAHGDVSNADLQISGTGGFRLDSGAIGRLHVDSSGVASVHIGGTVGDADVQLSGVGSVHIAKLTGKLDKDVSGVGDVSVGER